MNHENDSGAVNSVINKEDYKDPSGELLEKVTYLLRLMMLFFMSLSFQVFCLGTNVFDAKKCLSVNV